MKHYNKEDLLEICSKHLEIWIENEQKDKCGLEYERSFVETMRTIGKEMFEATTKPKNSRVSRKKK